MGSSRAFCFPHLPNLLESCSMCRPDHDGARLVPTLAPISPIALHPEQRSKSSAHQWIARLRRAAFLRGRLDEDAAGFGGDPLGGMGDVDGPAGNPRSRAPARPGFPWPRRRSPRARFHGQTARRCTGAPTRRRDRGAGRSASWRPAGTASRPRPAGGGTRRASCGRPAVGRRSRGSPAPGRAGHSAAYGVGGSQLVQGQFQPLDGPGPDVAGLSKSAEVQDGDLVGGAVIGATPRLGALPRGETIPWRVIASLITPREHRGSR